VERKIRLVEWRRHLHQNPELSFQEFKTSAYIQRELGSMGIEARMLEPTGAVGIINPDKQGPAVALRADIDALPLQDAKEVPYKSQVAGVAHACGHDGHTAILLGVAEALAARREEVPGRVVLIFQPAEEMQPGGAGKVIEQGWLEGVDWVFGLHLWAGIPVGYVALRSGPVMANADEFLIRVEGKGGHGSMPHFSVDSVLVACQIVTALQSVVSRSLNPLEPAVLSVGMINAGTAFNIIAQEAIVKGTYRSFSAGTRSLIEQRIKEIAEGVCAAHGAACQVECRRGYPAVINPEAGVEILKRAAVKVVGKKKVLTAEQSLGGEDFGYYLQIVLRAFLFLGATSTQLYPHHHPRFDFAEDAMAIGVDILVQVVQEALNEVGGPKSEGRWGLKS